MCAVIGSVIESIYFLIFNLNVFRETKCLEGEERKSINSVSTFDRSWEI